MRTSLFATILSCLFLAGSATAIQADAPQSDASKEFETKIRPMLAQYCYKCHGPEKQAADLRMDTLNEDFSTGETEHWHDVLNRLNLGEMPPPKSPHPTAQQQQMLVDWLTAGLRQAAAARRYADGRVVTRRLTRYEYQNTMQDLLGVKLAYAKDLPPDPISRDGFLNNGATLEMSPLQMETALAAARLGLAEAIVSGEPPKVHRHTVHETAVGKLPKRPAAGHVFVKPEFLMSVLEFPRYGEFEVKVRASAYIPRGRDFPRMRVSMGCVPGIIHVPHVLLGEVNVTAPLHEPQTFTFRGRMEDFPQPGDVPFGNVAFNGMVVLIDFLDADGNELRYDDRTYVLPPVVPKPGKKPKKPKEPEPVDPNEPAVAPQARLDIVIEQVDFQAPLITSWPPASHKRILFDKPADVDEPQYVRQVLTRFMTRAYRRPVETAEVEEVAELFSAIRGQVSSFEEAIRETLASVLISPHVLYVVEPRSETGKAERIGDFELASRLSYFLWSSMPDETLLQLAAQGKLSEPATLAAQLRRMLAGPRGLEFAQRFSDQWFDLEALDRVAINPEVFPDFDERLKEHMRNETRQVLAEILRTNGSCLDLLDSDWTMLNRPLAQHYGMNGPRTTQFERVTLPADRQRGGLLGQGAFLLANSNGMESHPIKRAVWILDRLLDSPPASPPPDVPELNPENPDLAGLTLKQQLEVHRKKESCNICHRGIDPWGIPLEQFDALGLLRQAPAAADDKPAKDGKEPAKGETSEATSVVETDSILPDGTELAGFQDLKDHLVNERQELFARAVVKRLASYSLGRSLDSGDEASVQDLTEYFVANEFRLESLMIQLVQSDLFQTK